MFFSVCFGLVRANLEFTVRIDTKLNTYSRLFNLMDYGNGNRKIDTKLNVRSRIFTLMEMGIGKCFDFYIHSELIFDKFDWIL